MRPTDLSRCPRVASRDARRYRALLRDLVLSVDASFKGLASEDVGVREAALMALMRMAERTERAGWPDGMSAKRSGR